MVTAWLAWLLAAACDVTKGPVIFAVHYSFSIMLFVLTVLTACLANSIAIRLAAYNLQPRSHAKSHCLSPLMRPPTLNACFTTSDPMCCFCFLPSVRRVGFRRHLPHPHGLRQRWSATSLTLRTSILRNAFLSRIRTHQPYRLGLVDRPSALFRTESGKPEFPISEVYEYYGEGAFRSDPIPRRISFCRR
ncbi:hypothetical protein BKA56DRAFT_54562 [Ilyonectria sp. MPI-CAGE-AT-0026]|nr:hypothetical protein BKA56DRAFT_54562 [Ilyonectria sp. MPI-CAGE-AT-0026]